MLQLKEVTFLYLLLANTHEARSTMILQALPTDAEKALPCILWSRTQSKHT